MRTFLITMTLLVAALASASPGPGKPEQTERRGKHQEDARAFARQVHYLVGQIGAYYVKPLSAEDLYVAAITGLYQSGRTPVPRDLRSQVRQAINLATALRDRSSPDLVIKPGDDPREQMLARLRDGLRKPLHGPAALRAACHGILTILDEHSGLITAEEQRLTAGLDRYSQGVGLEFDDHFGIGPLFVVTVHLGSPAQRAGLHPGDRIIKVDGQEIAAVPPKKLLALRTSRVLDHAPSLVPGDRRSSDTEKPIGPLRITYLRKGEDHEQSATLLPETFRPETILGVRRKDDNRWDYLLDEKENLAYLRITSLNRGTSEDLQGVLEHLSSLKVSGLLLDLRWCPGGYLNEAIRVADLFLGNAVIATEKSRDREPTVYRSAVGDKFNDATLVVLVNAESSGGAELITAALKDHGRAIVVGQRTRGKASVQVPLEVGEGMALKLTKGTFIRPSGKNLHRFRDNPDEPWGIIPDEDCRLSPELSKRLKEWHHLQALRPASSMRRLPLDDPNADTQRVAAIKELRKAVSAKQAAASSER